MKLVLLGGFGYIGSAVLEKISEDNLFKKWEIVVVDNWCYGRGMTAVYEYFKIKIKKFKFFCFDISDENVNVQDDFKSILSDADYIINLCSLTQVPSTNLHEKYIIDGVEKLSTIIRENCNNVKKIIDISSTSTYGSVQYEKENYSEPYTEQIFPNPKESLHNYASSKLIAEQIWISPKNKTLPVSILRLSTVFGYAVGLRYNQFINELIINYIAKRSTVVPGSPKNVRPFIHIIDTIKVFFKILELDKIGNNEIINIGDGELNKPLGQIYENISLFMNKNFGLKGDYKFAIEDDKDALQENYLVDFSKFQNLYNLELDFDFNSGAEHYINKIL
jgi:UDP-glucose 4-epimerase